MKIEDAIKQPKFRTEQEKAWINLAYTFNKLGHRVQKMLKGFGITSQQYNVLRILRGKGSEGACCSQVKEVMIDQNPDLTRLCDRLEAKGLISREVNASNRREIGLRITAAGLELLDRIEPVMRKNIRFLANLTDEEASMLSGLLDKLRGSEE